MSEGTEQFYNRFSFFYPLVDVFLKRQKRRLFQEVNNFADGNLLEVGVGNGSHLNMYLRHKITAIDTSAGMLEAARKHHLRNVRILRMDGQAMLFGAEQFDYVVLSHVIAVATEPEKLLSEVARVLKPNGKLFILNHFTPDNWLGGIDHAFGFFSKKLHFKSVFRIESIAAIERFTLIRQIDFAPASYFKLLIYEKR